MKHLYKEDVIKTINQLTDRINLKISLFTTKDIGIDLEKLKLMLETRALLVKEIEEIGNNKKVLVG